MKFNFTGKNMAVSEKMKERAEQKIGRLERLFPADAEFYVTLSSVKQTSRIEVTVPLYKRILRAETSAADMYAALDEVVDVLEKQVIKYKQRVKQKSRRDVSYKDELKMFKDAHNFDAPDAPEEAGDGDEIVIVKTKRFSPKPMDAEEAVLEMELLGHGFFVFRNPKNDGLNVVYKRKDGAYGLIEPEF